MGSIVYAFTEEDSSLKKMSPENALYSLENPPWRKPCMHDVWKRTATWIADGNTHSLIPALFKLPNRRGLTIEPSSTSPLKRTSNIVFAHFHSITLFKEVDINSIKRLCHASFSSLSKILCERSKKVKTMLRWNRRLTLNLMSKSISLFVQMSFTVTQITVDGLHLCPAEPSLHLWDCCSWVIQKMNCPIQSEEMRVVFW